MSHSGHLRSGRADCKPGHVRAAPKAEVNSDADSRDRRAPSGQGNRVFQKPNLLKRINVIWAVQSLLKKYSGFQFTQITSRTSSVSSHSRGVSRSSRTRGGMRWTRAALLTNSSDADGEVVWS